jgi:hypothetical protein
MRCLGRQWWWVVVLVSAVAWAQEAAPSEPIPDALPTPAGSPPPSVAPQPPANISARTFFGLHAAVNVGLISVDLHVGHSYSFLAANVGIPLVTNGLTGAFAVGSGYSFPLSAPGESMWVMDVFGVANPGWQRTSCFDCVNPTQFYVGLGVGIGFRYLHWSGFTFGLKAPVFGAAPGGGTSTSETVGTFYLANLIALPLVSFGYRW